MSHKLWSRFPLQVRHRFGGVRAFHFNRGYYFGFLLSMGHCLAALFFQLNIVTRAIHTVNMLHQLAHLLFGTTRARKRLSDYQKPPKATQKNPHLNGASSARSGTEGHQKIHLRSNACTLIVLLFLSCLCHQICLSQSLLQPIGQWREHLSYNNAIQVVNAGNKVFCATINNVYSVDATNTIERYSKVNGLNDIGVSTIGFDAASSQLVVVYNNSNIDVIKDRVVKNISDIKRSTISGNKNISSVYCLNKKAYLGSGLGVIVVDLERFEITDTWQIGSNGQQVKINAFTSDNQFFYAATDEGLKRANVSAGNLADYKNWNLINTLTPGKVRMVMHCADKIIALKNDSLFTIDGRLFYADAAWPVVNISTSESRLLICQRTIQGASRVLVVSTGGTIEKVLAQSGVISFPYNATIAQNAVWVADYFGGLSKFTNTVERLIPNGPPGGANGELLVTNETLYVAAGGVNDAWNYRFNRNGIYNFTNGDWNYKGAFNTPALDTVLDFISLAADPKDNSLWAGSYGGGLAHFEGNNISLYKQNSSLQPAIGDPLSYRVSGLAFDQQKNLWISNYGALQNLSVKKPDGTFKSFAIPFFHFENAVSQLLTDDANHLWIVSPRGNGVFVYNHGASVDNVNDDQWKYLRAGKGNGNLPDNNVFCVARDKDGFIWIGTAKGIGVVQCAADIFKGNSCEAILPVRQQDRFAGYLFQNEEVHTIAVDAANRKWIGTRNGVWLISADGDKTLARFTEDNSPLLSNDVNKIAINPSTGEVYFSTFKGICSFRSTAVEAWIEGKEVLVFPNPVPPGYKGTIAIKGLPQNSVVKIAELNGRLVFQTRALGGQAIWNGLNYKGELVASGVYLVLAKDDTGTEKLVTKIVLVK